MKKLLTLALLLFCATAQATTPAWVKNEPFVSGTSSPVSNVGSITPTNTGDALLVILMATGTGSFTGVTNSLGSTVIADNATAHTAVYRVASCLSGAQSFTISFTGYTEVYETTMEVSGLGSFDQTTAETSGTGTAVTTNSLTPSVNDEFILAQVHTNSGTSTFSSWTNSFTQGASYTSGPSLVDAYLVQTSGPTSVDAGVTLSASVTWQAELVSYEPAAAPTCTHDGLTSGGALAIPNGTSGSYRLENGSFGTPNCSTTEYFQPTVGNFGVD